MVHSSRLHYLYTRTFQYSQHHYRPLPIYSLIKMSIDPLGIFSCTLLTKACTLLKDAKSTKIYDNASSPAPSSFLANSAIFLDREATGTTIHESTSNMRWIGNALITNDNTISNLQESFHNLKSNARIAT